MTHTKDIKLERAFVFGGVSLKRVGLPEKVAVVSGGKVKKAAGWFWDSEKGVLYVYPTNEIKSSDNTKEPARHV